MLPKRDSLTAFQIDGPLNLDAQLKPIAGSSGVMADLTSEKLPRIFLFVRHGDDKMFVFQLHRRHHAETFSADVNGDCRNAITQINICCQISGLAGKQPDSESHMPFIMSSTIIGNTLIVAETSHFMPTDNTGQSQSGFPAWISTSEQICDDFKHDMTLTEQLRGGTEDFRCRAATKALMLEKHRSNRGRVFPTMTKLC